MKIFAVTLAVTAVLTCAQAAQAQSFRPLPAVTTPIPIGDDNEIAAVLPFNIKVGSEAPYNAIVVSQNAAIYKSDLSDLLTNYFDDLLVTATTGQANFGSSTVNGRPAFIATHSNVAYCCSVTPGGPRANVQIVVIDRSDIAPGDFDYEINTQGLARVPAIQSFQIDGVGVGRAGVPEFSAGSQAYRSTWTFRNGQLTSGTGPTLIAAAAAVPTMTEWAMILFGTMLAGGAALYLQRRRLIA